MAIDHARRYAGSEAEREQLADTVAALDATLQIARAVGGQSDLGAVLALVAKRARDLVSATHADHRAELRGRTRDRGRRG